MSADATSAPWVERLAEEWEELAAKLRPRSEAQAWVRQLAKELRARALQSSYPSDEELAAKMECMAEADSHY